MLKVGVHEYAVIPVCSLKPRIHRRLLSEVAGKGDIVTEGVAGSERFQNLQRAVAASVVHKQKFCLRVRQPGNGLLSLPIEQRSASSSL